MKIACMHVLGPFSNRQHDAWLHHIASCFYCQTDLRSGKFEPTSTGLPRLWMMQGNDHTPILNHSVLKANWSTEPIIGHNWLRLLNVFFSGTVEYIFLALSNIYFLAGAVERFFSGNVEGFLSWHCWISFLALLNVFFSGTASSGRNDVEQHVHVLKSTTEGSKRLVTAGQESRTLEISSNTWSGLSRVWCI